MGLNNSRPELTDDGYRKMCQDYYRIDTVNRINKELQILRNKFREIIENLDSLCEYYTNQGYSGLVFYETMFLPDNFGFHKRIINSLNKQLWERYPDRAYEIFIRETEPSHTPDIYHKQQFLIDFLSDSINAKNIRNIPLKNIPTNYGFVSLKVFFPYQDHQLSITELQPLPTTSPQTASL